MLPVEIFRHCPKCGVPLATQQNPLLCSACGFRFFFNPTCAAAGFLRDEQGKYLFIRRAKEPQAGKLAVPGGFIDMGEPAEDALRRETLEEVGVEIANISFICSLPNLYPYGGVTYPVVDFIFTADAIHPETARPLDAVAGIEWRTLDDVDVQELAFPSLVLGWQHLLLKQRSENLPLRDDVL